MNDEIIVKLKELIATHGADLCTNGSRLKSFLLDYAGQHRLEINLLVAAAREGVAAQIHKLSGTQIDILQFERLTRHLHKEAGIDEKYAEWAVASWAEALGKQVQRVSPPPSCKGDISPLQEQVATRNQPTMDSDSLPQNTEPATSADGGNELGDVSWGTAFFSYFGYSFSAIFGYYLDVIWSEMIWDFSLHILVITGFNIVIIFFLWRLLCLYQQITGIPLYLFSLYSMVMCFITGIISKYLEENVIDHEHNVLLVLLVLFGFVYVFGQWFLLRPYLRMAIWWIPASAIGLGFGMLVSSKVPTLVGAGYSLLTAPVLYWLLRYPK